MMLFIKFIKNFGKTNSIVLFICILLLLFEFVDHRHGEFKIEEFLFFPALFGYISCIVIFKVGVALRSIFMRDEDYYD